MYDKVGFDGDEDKEARRGLVIGAASAAFETPFLTLLSLSFITCSGACATWWAWMVDEEARPRLVGGAASSHAGGAVSDTSFLSGVADATAAAAALSLSVVQRSMYDIDGFYGDEDEGHAAAFEWHIKCVSRRISDTASPDCWCSVLKCSGACTTWLGLMATKMRRHAAASSMALHHPTLVALQRTVVVAATATETTLTLAKWWCTR
jgi:hypothetical protein